MMPWLWRNARALRDWRVMDWMWESEKPKVNIVDDGVRTLVLVFFYEVVETFPERFKNQAHVVSFFVLKVEVLLEVNNAALCPSLILNVNEYVAFNLCALVVPLDSSYHL